MAPGASGKSLSSPSDEKSEGEGETSVLPLVGLRFLVDSPGSTGGFDYARFVLRLGGILKKKGMDLRRGRRGPGNLG